MWMICAKAQDLHSEWSCEKDQMDKEIGVLKALQEEAQTPRSRSPEEADIK